LQKAEVGKLVSVRPNVVVVHCIILWHHQHNLLHCTIIKHNELQTTLSADKNLHLNVSVKYKQPPIINKKRSTTTAPLLLHFVTL